MSPTWRTIFLATVGLLVLCLAYQARAVVTPLLVALVLAYILDPVARLLERRGLSRGVASATIVIVVLATLVTVVAVAATRFAGEATAFYDDVAGEPAADVGESQAFIQRMVADESDKDARDAIKARILQAKWDGRTVSYFDRDGDLTYRPGYAAMTLSKIHAALADERWAAPIKQALDGLSQFGPKIAQSANAVLGGLVEGGRAVFTGIIGLLTVAVLFPIYLFYSLVNLSRVYDVTVRHLPEGQRARIVDILEKIHLTISAFFRGRLITMLVKGVLLLAVFVSFDVPLSYVCAAFGALASLVPVVGGLAAAIPPLVLAFPSSSGGAVIGLLIAILVIEGIEGYLLIPGLIGKRVGLHPLTVLVCTLVAGDLLGLFGMIVAVPLTAVLKILAAEFVVPEVRRRAGLPPLGAEDAGPKT